MPKRLPQPNQRPARPLRVIFEPVPDPAPTALARVYDWLFADDWDPDGPLPPPVDKSGASARLPEEG